MTSWAWCSAWAILQTPKLELLYEQRSRGPCRGFKKKRALHVYLWVRESSAMICAKGKLRFREQFYVTHVVKISVFRKSHVAFRERSAIVTAKGQCFQHRPWPMTWKPIVVSMILVIMKYVLKYPAKDTVKVSRKGKLKLRFAKRPFPDAIILITAEYGGFVS